MSQQPPFLDDYPEEEDEDWFGEGSPFDSGEDLAAALIGMGGGDASAIFAFSTAPEHDSDYGSGEFEEVERSDTPSWSSKINAPAPQGAGGDKPRVMSREEQLDQVLSRAQGGSTPAPTTWSSRNSTKVMRMTEDMMARLQAEAIETALRAASIAVHQRPGRKRRPGDDDLAA